MPTVVQFRDPYGPTRTGAGLYGVGAGLQGMGQALLTYDYLHKQDSLQKLAIYDKLLSAYGDDPPQAMLSDMNRLMKDQWGIGLPIQPETGEFAAPTPGSTLDVMIAKRVRQHPEMIDKIVEARINGMSPAEMALKEKQFAAQQHHYDAMENMQRNHYNYLEAEARRKETAGRPDLEPSRYVQMPDGSIQTTAKVLADHGGVIPPGALEMTVGQSKAHAAEVSAESLAGFRQAQIEMNKAKSEMDRLKVENSIRFGEGRALVDAIKVIGNPKSTPESRNQARGPLETFLRHMGIEDNEMAQWLKPEQEGGFLASILHDILGSPEGAAQDQQNRATGHTPPVGGSVTGSKGTVFWEEVKPTGGAPTGSEPDDYDKRIQEFLQRSGRPEETAAPSAAPEEVPRVPPGTTEGYRSRVRQLPAGRDRAKGLALANALMIEERAINEPQIGPTPYHVKQARALLQQLDALLGK